MIIDLRSRFSTLVCFIALGILILAIYFILKADRNSSEFRLKFSEFEIKKEISSVLSDSTKDLSVFGCKLIIRPFFNAFNPKGDLLFVSENGLSRKGDTLLNIISKSERFGLRAADYHLDRINDLLPLAFQQTEDDKSNLSSIARLELLLSDAYLKFGAHLNRGRFNPDTLLLEWDPKKLDTTWLTTLRTGIIHGGIKSALSTLEPNCFEYSRLKQYLSLLITESYKKSSSKNDSGSISTSEKQSFVRSISEFALLNKNDSCLENYSISYLHDTVRSKIMEYLKMDMERYRWKRMTKPKQYAIVNIPTADLTVYGRNSRKRCDTITMYSRVIVGKPDTPTPTLSSSINHFLVYPYWNVPLNIAVTEILPVVKRDTGYLNRRNYEVIDSKGKVIENPGTLKWKHFNEDYFPIRLRQKWGLENSLGVCKFNFENKYSVYLHDTNSKRYFRSENRYQSHGCIRIERFKDLAAFLIKINDIKISEDSLCKIFNTPEQRRIELKTPLRIWIEYRCIKFNQNGQVCFYKDAYNINRKMTKLLEG